MTQRQKQRMYWINKHANKVRRYLNELIQEEAPEKFIKIQRKRLDYCSTAAKCVSDGKPYRREVFEPLCYWAAQRELAEAGLA